MVTSVRMLTERGILASHRRLRDRVVGRHLDPQTTREDVARRYLTGSGIEVGALNFPLRLPPSARATYVDYLPPETLLEHHAHLVHAGQALTLPDIVDDGERLGKIGSGSLDFVVANHMIEHAEDPIGMLKHHLRVLRPGGITFLAVPDKRFTFDADRPITPLDHLVRDHREGPGWSRRDHYLEWAALVDRRPPEEVPDHADTLAERRFSIHFHVWDLPAFADLLTWFVRQSGIACQIEHLQASGEEFIAVLRKPG